MKYRIELKPLRMQRIGPENQPPLYVMELEANSPEEAVQRFAGLVLVVVALEGTDVVMDIKEQP